MSTQPRTPTPRMTVEEFLAWAEGRPGRHELVRGEVIAQAAERAAHWEVKLATHVALLAAIKAKALPCHVVPDGATVRIDDTTAYEPDAMVFCGPKPPPSALLVENPVIIVEVLSPIDGAERSGAQAGGLFPPAEPRALSDHRSRRDACHPPPAPRRRRHSDAHFARGDDRARSAGDRGGGGGDLWGGGVNLMSVITRLHQGRSEEPQC